MPVTSFGVIEDTADINKSIAETFAFVADFANIQDWDPGVKSSKRSESTQGPLGVGTSFDLVTVFKGNESKMTYTITEYNPPHLVVLEGNSDTVHALDTIRFTAPDATHTHIEYKADLTLKGLRRPFIALISSALDELGKNAMNGLMRRLNKGLPKL
eukprot:m.221829 g.221829  ORF g.221829 m.221829 type:complete len:157 (-) comp15895_c0_seq1:41-511(-)